jgi:hypothetical protein
MDSIAKRRHVEHALRLEVPLRVDLLPRYPGVAIPSDPNNCPIRRVFVNMPGGSHDITLTEEGISETLIFDGENVRCFLPWDAVFWVSSEVGVCYIDETERLDVQEALAEVRRRLRPHSTPDLKVVRGEKVTPAPKPEPRSADVIPMLRVVR